MYQDPFDDTCRYIINIITCFVMMIALSVYYACTLLKHATILAYLRLKGVYIEVYFFLLKKWSHLYFMHINPWLIVFGLKPEITWLDVEQHRLQVSAKWCCEIPRSPDLEEGLRQEGYL